jgi:hypothetical protein
MSDKSQQYIKRKMALEEMLDRYKNEEKDLNYDPSVIIKMYNNLNADKESEIKVFEFLDKYCKNTEGLVNENPDYDYIIDELDEKMVVDETNIINKDEKPLYIKKRELMSLDVKDEKVKITPTEYKEEMNTNAMNVDRKDKFKKVKKNEKKLIINDL